MRTLSLLFFSLFIVSIAPLSLAQDFDPDRWEKWQKLEGAIATKGKMKIAIFSNPRNPNNLMLFPICWSIMRDTKEIVLPSCHFELKDNILYCDKTLQNRRKNGSVSGVAWNDPKMLISSYSLLIRRPVFTDTSVKFWDGENWIEITGLAKISEN